MRVLRRVVVLAPLDQQERTLGLSKQRVPLGHKILPQNVDKRHSEGLERQRIITYTLATTGSLA